MKKMISQKKLPYPVSDNLRKYLKHYGRCANITLDYQELCRFSDAVPLESRQQERSCWISVSYPAWEQREINLQLLQVYAALKADGDIRLIEHLTVDRIDYCLFGNSGPFRIRIINRLNDNFDYFYVKRADASRIYGLELEHLLSPNRIGFLLHQNTLVIEHIYGIPGDIFIEKYLDRELNEVRLAKEFVKFNERCFLRLLGDMHPANYVVDVTLDVEDSNYRIRAIDFDQQSYEGRKKVYLPQYYHENNPIILIGMKALTSQSVRQYQREERYLIEKRMISARYRLKNLFRSMENDTIAPDDHFLDIRNQLAEHYKQLKILRTKGMGELVRASLGVAIESHKHQFR